MSSDDNYWQLAIVGAGPCGLAVLARLVQDLKSCCSCPTEAALARDVLERTIVIDPSGEWLVGWRSKLGSQGVDHLRSPTFVHPHPSRAIDDALLAFAAGRPRDLLALDGLELSGELRAHAWHAPSAALFDEFCDELLRHVEVSLPPSAMPGRLPTAAHVYRARVIDVRPLPPASVSGRRVAANFEVALADGLPSLFAARVVLAVADGGGAQVVPDWHAAARESGAPPGALMHASDLAALHPIRARCMPFVASRGSDGGGLEGTSRGRVAHSARRRLRRLLHRGAAIATRHLERALAGRPRLSWLLARAALARRVSREMRPHGSRRLVIVGGGLSAAQLAIRALGLGWRRVVLVVRGELAVRPFDIEVRRVSGFHPCRA